MNHVIYVDVYFFLNLIMDLIILISTDYLLNLHSAKLRIIVAAINGAFWASVSIAISPVLIFTVLYEYILIPITMVLIAFGYVNRQLFIKTFILMYMITFVSGGISQLIVKYTGVIFMAIINYALIHLLVLIIKISRERNTYYGVCIKYKGNVCNAKGLLDTGNDLYDSLKLEPVSVIEKSTFDKLTKGDDYSTKYRIVEYNSLGKNGGFMLGFEPDIIEINNNLDKTIRIVNPLVAIYNGKLSSKNEYNMILHKDLVNIRGKI